MIKIFSSRLLSVVATVFSVWLIASAASPAANPKREFRGAWIHTVFQDDWRKRSTEENKRYIRTQLDKLRRSGINVVLFQIRPQSDAFYSSKYEPWSIFLTGNGRAPRPYWDPLEYIIDEAHARGMELHAWLNPYRVTSSAAQKVPEGHLFHKHPERFVRYDGKVYFDPGRPENRKYITTIVADIVKRYDIDGIHFDDYFYPYPAKGKQFPDAKSYARYGKEMKLDDWRRDNVNRLIEEVSREIARLKPWLRFGVSPFGIWRNKKSDSRGSDTNGLENYDSLYADVILWVEKGWVDYLIPQLYWDIEHPRASYATLVDWWNRNAGKRHIYVGQHIEVTMKKSAPAPSRETTQLKAKIDMTRDADKILGNCWWPSTSLTGNFGGIADSLSADRQGTIAIPPSYSWKSTARPESPFDLHALRGSLWWSAPATNGQVNDCVRFVVYRFDNDDSFDLDDASKIVCVTPDNHYKIDKPGYYVVTSLDRVNNESLPTEPLTIK